MKKYFISGLLIGLLALPAVGLAQGNLNSALGNLNNVSERAGTAGASLESVVGRLINGALSLVGIIFLVLMVYAGYLWMTARGEEEQVKKAQSIIRSSIIGIVIVVSAYAITFFITTKLGSVGGNSSGEVGCCRSRASGVDQNTAQIVADSAACTSICATGTNRSGCSFTVEPIAAQCN